jgi:hypothetical protein
MTNTLLDPEKCIGEMLLKQHEEIKVLENKIKAQNEIIFNLNETLKKKDKFISKLEHENSVYRNEKSNWIVKQATADGVYEKFLQTDSYWKQRYDALKLIKTAFEEQLSNTYN